MREQQYTNADENDGQAAIIHYHGMFAFLLEKKSIKRSIIWSSTIKLLCSEIKKTQTTKILTF